MPAPGGRDFLQAYNCQAVVDSAHQVRRGGSGHQPDFGQAAGGDDGGGGHRQRRRSAQRGVRRRRLLLCTGGRRSVRAVRGPVRRAGADRWTPRQSGAASAPGSHTQSSVSQGPDAPEADKPNGARQRYALRMQTVEPVFGQIKQGRGLPAVPAAGTGEGQRRVVADLHRSQPAQAVQVWGGSASRNADKQVCRKCPEHRRGGRHSEAYETIGPSVAAPGNNSCRRLTSPVPKARQSILRRAASLHSNAALAQTKRT